ncbi:hypothetical protein [Methylovulum psychrotolerans]|uniref:hypothetical protein n=1 Tax=Methylovulum psychrotolerans TaxID=1704499 RepID=UPI0012F8F469|nr:hypothetical protein [Methylovulum psychrotolerans]
MPYLLETFIFFIGVAGPTSIMLAAAFLMYKRVHGCGWYLIAAVLVVSSTNIKFNGWG